MSLCLESDILKPVLAWVLMFGFLFFRCVLSGVYRCKYVPVSSFKLRLMLCLLVVMGLSSIKWCVGFHGFTRQSGFLMLEVSFDCV